MTLPERAANPSHALGAVLADELVRAGVTDAVIAPGSRSTALAMALEAEPGLRAHVEIDERSAGFLAVGMARVTGRPAAVVTTSGTATANLHPAVVEADAARVPLLVLTADRPPERRHSGANQTIDQLGLYGGAVRWFCEVGIPEDRPGSVPYWRSTVCRAVATAAGRRGPAGPVHLNLSFREPTVPATDDGRSAAEHAFRQPLDGRDGGAPWTEVTAVPRAADDGTIAALARRVAAAGRGVVVAGDGIPAPEAVTSFAEAAGWPLLAEPQSGARRGPSAVAHGHHLLSSPAFASAHRPDLVVRVGRANLSRALLDWLPPEVPQVVVDPVGDWTDPRRSVRELIVADPADLLGRVAAALDSPAEDGWVDAWRRADAAAAEAIEEVLAGEAGPSGPQVARDVAAAVPGGGVLVAGSSLPIRDLDRYMAPRDGLRIVGNRGASGIDGLVSVALGAAVAHDGPVVALLGDLTFLHDLGGLLLSPAAGGVDCVFVVVDNDGGGIFHLLPQAGYPSFERLFGTPHGRDLADAAALHRLGYDRVGEPSRVAPSVEEGLTGGGLHLVHVPTDRRAGTDLRHRITAAVARSLQRGPD